MQTTRANSYSTMARKVLPGGNFGNLNTDLVIASGKGGRVCDESGKEYVDYLLGSGPMLIGHAHPHVVAAIQEQIQNGTTFFVNNPQGIRLAQEIVEAVPCAELVRFTSSGSEADMYAMRLVRAYSGRPKILKFEGGYHGMSDLALMSLYPKGPSVIPRAVPDSPGIPAGASNDILVAAFNDTKGAVALIEEHAAELGGVMVEPFQRLIPPVPGFLESLREITTRLGIPLVFDEVVTGFRLAYGGAQERYGVTPDLCTLGKVCGGGFPLAAIAGRRDIMSLLDRNTAGDDKYLIQVGTLSGNPVAAAAGLATLEVLRTPGTYERLYARGEEMVDVLSGLAKRSGLPATVVGSPVVFDVVFAEGPITNYRDTLRANGKLSQRFNASLRESGILKGDSKHYLSTAHTDEDVRITSRAWELAFKTISSGG